MQAHVNIRVKMLGGCKQIQEFVCNVRVYRNVCTYISVHSSYINVVYIKCDSQKGSRLTCFYHDYIHRHHHHHVQEGLGLITVPCILKMKLVRPSLPRSPYVSSSFWFILQCLFSYPVCVHPLYVLLPLFLVLFYFLYYILCSRYDYICQLTIFYDYKHVGIS